MAFVNFLVLLALGLPIAFVIGLSSLVQMQLMGEPTVYKILAQMVIGGMDNFPLLAIPFFVLAGNLMNSAGITRELVRVADAIVGRFRAGLAHVSVVSSIFFAGITGSAVAEASALGSILIPAMEEDGYPRPMSAGLIAAAAVIGPIIPPSIVAIIYSYVTGVSVAGLFLAGVIPGVLMGLTLMGLVYWQVRYGSVNWGKRSGAHETGETSRYTWLKAAAVLLMPVIILGGILGGVFTATEASAVAVAYAMLIGFVFRTLRFKDVLRAFENAAIASAVVFLIIGVSASFQWVIARERLVEPLTRFVAHYASGPVTLLALANIILLIAGMFLDTTPAILILVPVLAPIAISMGVNPLHFGAIVVINLSIGLVTPPLGLTLFAASSISGEPLQRIIHAAIPYILAEIAVLILVTYFPPFTLGIPHIFGFM